MSKKKLDDKVLRGLKPGPVAYDVWDSVLKGFAIRVGTTGAKSFFVGTRIRGKYKRITIGQYGEILTLAEARR
ncbi:MAG TPA: Arm DNA-binding domain-containing protein, partial [Methyloceanibacter sp.]|nr:Arm DNA-binding domain-containing protein [Methyloceanibacter sp.]